MILNTFFDKLVCLTVYDHEWQKAVEEFERVGLTGVEKFQALPVDSYEILGPHQSFSGSVRRILSEFYNSGAKTLLHLEDDCVFRDLGYLEQALSEVPRDWDLLYLGCNIRGDVVRITDHIYKLSDAWTTHCLGFNRKAIPYILKHQPGFSEQLLDNWLGGQLTKLNGYVINPMVAWQRAHYSGIWDRWVDYDDVFTLSQEKLI